MVLILIQVENISDIYFFKELLIKVTLDDKTSDFSLLQRFLEDVFFNCIYANETVNVNCFGLPDSMTPILGLFVHGRIPIGIIENDAVSTCQINTNASASGRRYETEYLAIEVKSVDKLLPVLGLDRSIKSHINVAVEIQELFKYVQHFGHLGEYDDFGSLIIECFQKLC